MTMNTRSDRERRMEIINTIREYEANNTPWDYIVVTTTLDGKYYNIRNNMDSFPHYQIPAGLSYEAPNGGGIYDALATLLHAAVFGVSRQEWFDKIDPKPREWTEDGNYIEYHRDERGIWRDDKGDTADW